MTEITVAEALLIFAWLIVAGICLALILREWDNIGKDDK